MDLNDLQALMGGDFEAEEARDFWVIDLEGLPVELLGEARRLADSLGAYVHYVGSANSDEAIAFGADRVHPLTATSGDEALAALRTLFETHKPEFIFLPISTLTYELAGRLAHHLKGGLIQNCIAIQLDSTTREITGSFPVYEGAYYLDVAVTAKPAIVSLQPQAFTLPYRDPGRTGEVEPLEVTPTESRVRALGPVDYAPPLAPLHKAAKVLALGRAGNDADSVAVAKQIAEKIGAQLAGDRSAFDSGWITREQIVGVVGTEIAPDVYIAAGIWGDTLHRVGVEGAKQVIAIHPDKNAPIFKYADVAIVGQPKDVLPQLLQLLA